MNIKVTSLLKIWWPLLIFVLLWLLTGAILMTHNYDTAKNLSVNLISSWDIASSVALSVLAFIAYYHHASEKHRQSKFLKELAAAKDASQHTDAKGAIVIQIGGSNLHAITEAQHFMQNVLQIPQELIVSKIFGDDKNNISIEDIDELTHWLQNDCMRLLAYTHEVHIIISGIGIAFAITADTLNNWKTLCFYHKTSLNSYELWYADKKSEQKNKAPNPQKDLS